MARREKIVTVLEENRDKGKQFRLVEMPAFQAEKWATRALLALGKSNVDLGFDIGSAGAQGLALLGLRAITSLSFEEAEPLLDEMMTCVTFLPDKTNAGVQRALIADDIEEVSTILMLRNEVAQLHLGFSIAARLSSLGAVALETPNVSSNT